MQDEGWLDRWLPAIAERSAGAPVLELGCGGGHDTERLARAGVAVLALDISPDCVAAARARNLPGVDVRCGDLRAALPVPRGGVGTVIASLCLHYFEWEETADAAARIRQALRPGGLLLARFNSVRDTNYGASGYPRIAKDFYLVNGQTKRFFSRETLADLFAGGWTFLCLEEKVIGSPERPKIAWEAAVEKTPDARDGA